MNMVQAVYEMFISNHKLDNGANPRHYSLSIKKI